MIDINELRMMVHDFKRVGSPRLLLQTTQMGELLDRLEAVEKERDTLRSLVVMRFDHEHPPQFVQGYDPHDLLEPVTAEHCRWFVAEIVALRAKIAEMEKQEPVMWANSSTINSSRINKERGGRGDQHTCSETQTAYHDTQLYALPGAQGE